MKFYTNTGALIILKILWTYKRLGERINPLIRVIKAETFMN